MVFDASRLSFAFFAVLCDMVLYSVCLVSFIRHPFFNQQPHKVLYYILCHLVLSVVRLDLHGLCGEAL